ncbi:MAG: metallophosphoesterase, partial [Actinomycetia bacterium]|nr:metallophosphoesterase [Actinomycetes bacterium]
METLRTLRRAAYVFGIVALILLVAYGALAWSAYSSSGRFPTEGAKYPTQRIRELIWPTVGYPAMVTPGGLLEVEVDLRDVAGKGQQAEDASEWRAVIKPTPKELTGLTYTLTPEGARRAVSDRWPEGTRLGGPDAVWHVSFHVPAEAVPELYDLYVEVRAFGRLVSDSQPHAVSVAADDDDDFTFISLADIHVHRRGISGWMQQQTDKGISPEGRPVYFENAIDQVNLIRPDFVVLLGDFVRAQYEPGDYQVEFEEFYRALEAFEVPLFAVPGNHDLYVNEVDGARVWEENLGPLYYSFDVGGCHFTCVNTYQWPVGDRIVMKKPGLFVYPKKWQGQVLEAGDEGNPSTYRGQLAWIRDDLAANPDSPLKFVLLHHCPFTPDGEGMAYDNERFAGVFSLGGNGKGRDALKELASMYGVDMVLSGHLHHDNVGSAPWADGGGETVYASQTCVYYDEGGTQEKYPGYRLFKVAGGRVESFTYTDGVHSIPFYDGSVLGGETDLEHLDRPALSARRIERAEMVTLRWEVESYLAVPMELKGLIAVVPGAGGVTYSARGGEIYQTLRVPGDPDRVVLYVKTEVEKGEPGPDTTTPGTPARNDVTVVPSGEGTGDGITYGPVIYLPY